MHFSEATKSYEKQRFTDIYENTDKGRYLSTAHENTAKGNAPAAKKYETKDEDFDEEGIENPYGDLYINEETISDISIRDLGQVIKDKRRNEDDGFKREYAVSVFCKNNTKCEPKIEDNLILRTHSFKYLRYCYGYSSTNFLL